MRTETAYQILNRFRDDGRYPLIDTVYEESDCIQAMKEFAKQKCEEQRKLLHDTLTKLVSFDTENENADFVIDVMKQTEYPDEL